MDTDVSLLQGTELFKNLSPEQIRKVLNICRPVRFSENDVIMKEGELGDSMYVIMEGTVEEKKRRIKEELEAEDKSGKNRFFPVFEPSPYAVFGEIALLEELRRTATVRA